MSHFVTYVIVPQDTPAGEMYATVERMLEPFNENRSVPEYESDCSCIGRIARREASQSAGKAWGTIEQLRKAFSRECPDIPFPGNGKRRELSVAEEKAWQEANVEREEKWIAFTADRRRAEEKAFREHPHRDKPDPNCGRDSDTGEWLDRREYAVCHGTGKYPSTYNPLSKWDWWVVGGRWDGYIQGDEANRDWQEHFAALESGEGTEIVKNSINAKTLKEVIHKSRERTPYAVLTPDGKWHAQAEMGWWGLSHHETEADWPEQVIEILDAHDADWVIACDLHI